MVYNAHERMNRLGQRMKQINAIAIQVTQDGETITILDASQGKTCIEEMMPGLEVSQNRYHDWFCDVAQYTFPIAGTVRPKAGAVITRVSDGAKFLVVSPRNSDKDDAPYDFTLPTEIRYRIHTVQHPNEFPPDNPSSSDSSSD